MSFSQIKCKLYIYNRNNIGEKASLKFNSPYSDLTVLPSMVIDFHFSSIPKPFI